MNSLCRALGQSTRRTRSCSLQFLLHSSYSISSSSSNSFATNAKPSTVSQLKSRPLPSSSDWPRPREIPFQAKVANSVNLVGYVSQPIQFQASPHSQNWAATVITQNPSFDSPPLRIPIIFEGNLAHVASSHLKKGDYVYIAGQLISGSPPIDVIGGQAQVWIMVDNMNFVQVSSQITKGYGRWQQDGGFLHRQQEGPLKYNASTNKDGDSALNSWRDLLDNQKQWWDYRSNKRSGLAHSRHPDFKRKDGGVALWLDRAPGWILSELEKLEFHKIPKSKQGKPFKTRAFLEVGFKLLTTVRLVCSLKRGLFCTYLSYTSLCWSNVLL
ncbi:protein OSB2, chloroplastic isoform X3 [Hevea brasiliensis]|uniref:protein OSB2, chloroplastic isoform X3 n=1 Tax=Hevea brasiliensis TaxID=3981 RepID=UPI0025F41021|nr:protein OSB2, chloroplastic isoform X3 [Hevea brasiliensis]